MPQEWGDGKLETKDSAICRQNQRTPREEEGKEDKEKTVQEMFNALPNSHKQKIVITEEMLALFAYLRCIKLYKEKSNIIQTGIYILVANFVVK